MVPVAEDSNESADSDVDTTSTTVEGKEVKSLSQAIQDSRLLAQISKFKMRVGATQQHQIPFGSQQTTNILCMECEKPLDQPGHYRTSSGTCDR